MATTILTVNDLSQRFGTELIFSGVSFIVTEREHIGLVGVNGSGKSSLLRIIGGMHEPAGGVISRAVGLRVAYQAQEARFDAERSLYDEALDAFSEVRATGARLSSIEQEMANADGEALDRLFDEYSTLSAEFEARHGYEMEHRTAQVLSGLGFPEEMFTEPVRQLSGGQKTRVALAKALLSDPDLLLLDEPTNHLDLAAIEWLEGFLQNYNRSYIIVSHDRYFLEKTTTRTLELHFGRLEEYPASYLGYLKLRGERRTRQQKEFEEQQEFIARTEEFIRKYKAGQRSREAKGRETRLARLERIDAPQETKRFKLSMRAISRSGQMVLNVQPMSIGYPPRPDESGPTVLVRTPELVIERGDRVALIGPNGAGKTTALRTIVGELPALKGAAQFGTNVKLAYYAQGHEGLDPHKSAIETILYDQPIGEEVARNLLGAFLFSDDDVYKPVAALSGGERSRLALARLTMAKANFLVLDEPTNHLDIPARETLEEGLAGYDGTLLFVSHDRFFIDRVATRVWAIEDGRLAQYLGNYSDMLNERARRNGQAPTIEPPKPERKAAEQEPAPVESRPRPRSRQYDKLLREAQRRLATAERAVARHEERLMEIEDRLNRATVDQKVDLISTLGVAHEETQRELDLAYAEWSAAGAELEQLNAEAALAADGS